MQNGRFRIEKPSDFNEYWENVKETATRCDPEVAIERWELEDPNFEAEYILDGNVPEKATDQEGCNPFDYRFGSHTLLMGMNVEKVTFRSYDGQEVGGLLQYPRMSHKKKLPAIVHFTGYGGELIIDPDFVTAGYAVFNFSHRGMHWGSKNFDRYHPTPLLVRGVEDHDSYVYRSVVIDCLLAVEVLRKISFVDRNRIGVMGTSQGGALSVITTVLDKGVKAASADIPWMTNYEYQLNHKVEGPYNEIKEFLRRYPEKTGDVLETLGYFDTVCFADQIASAHHRVFGHCGHHVSSRISPEPLPPDRIDEAPDGNPRFGA